MFVGCHAGYRTIGHAILSSILACVLVVNSAFANGAGSTIYLPLTLSSGDATVTPGHTSPPPPPPCKPNEQEQQIASLLIDSAEQRRPQLVCNGFLAQVARARAADMAARGYFSHTNPDGHGPNYLVTQAGYVLPSYYHSDPAANNIESIAAGYSKVQAVWEGWMNSEKHRIHLMAEKSFYAEQIEYGIGYYFDQNSEYEHYWVVLIARPGP